MLYAMFFPFTGNTTSGRHCVMTRLQNDEHGDKLQERTDREKQVTQHANS